MTDEIIKFETAKLAKEKGLVKDLICAGVYCIGFKTILEDREFILEDYNRQTVEGQFHLALAPTQSLLQRWLREKYQINVYPILSYTNNQKYTIELRFDFSRISTSQTGLTEKVYYDTYEDALEVGLVAALKLIKV